MPASLYLSYGTLYDALDTRRRARSLRWRDVAAETGVSESTFTRLKQARGLDVENLLRLVDWLNPDTLNLDPYVARSPR